MISDRDVAFSASPKAEIGHFARQSLRQFRRCSLSPDSTATLVIKRLAHRGQLVPESTWPRSTRPICVGRWASVVSGDRGSPPRQAVRPRNSAFTARSFISPEAIAVASSQSHETASPTTWGVERGNLATCANGTLPMGSGAMSQDFEKKNTLCVSAFAVVRGFHAASTRTPRYAQGTGVRLTEGPGGGTLAVQSWFDAFWHSSWFDGKEPIDVGGRSARRPPLAAVAGDLGHPGSLPDLARLPQLRRRPGLSAAAAPASAGLRGCLPTIRSCERSTRSTRIAARSSSSTW